MADSLSNTVFSNTTPNKSPLTEKDTENKKLSYWLQKLHIQGEQLRKATIRREKEIPMDPQTKPILSSEKAKDLAQSGINEHTRNIATKKEDDTQIVNDLVKKSNRRIISISSQFPWELFSNTIDVEESRVTFTFSQFLSSQSHSVDIKDISNVFIESTMLFSSLQVVSRTYVQNDIKIGNLNKAKAKKVQTIIEGLRTFAEHDINTSNYETEELIAKIGELHTHDSVA